MYRRFGETRILAFFSVVASRQISPLFRCGPAFLRPHPVPVLTAAKLLQFFHMRQSFHVFFVPPYRPVNDSLLCMAVCGNTTEDVPSLWIWHILCSGIFASPPAGGGKWCIMLSVVDEHRHEQGEHVFVLLVFKRQDQSCTCRIGEKYPHIL